MSVWTHVAGVIRYDTYSDVHESKFKQLLGKTAEYGDFADESNDEHLIIRNPNDNDLPCGSEGSIHYDILETYHGTTIVFVGDLRDFEPIQHPEIEAWFKRVTGVTYEEHGFSLRMGVIEYGTAYGPTTILKAKGGILDQTDTAVEDAPDAQLEGSDGK